MADRRVPESASESRPDRPRKRPYTSPRVIEYGSVAKLTRGTRSVSSDFPQAGFKKMDCL
jgi:hypothetical protein